MQGLPLRGLRCVRVHHRALITQEVETHVHARLHATDGAGDETTPLMRVEWLPSNRERIAELGIDVWVEEQPRRWCSSTETEKQAIRWEWITPNSVTRAWGVETEERDGVRTVKTWAEWSVVRPNPNQESRRGAAEGRID